MDTVFEVLSNPTRDVLARERLKVEDIPEIESIYFGNATTTYKSRIEWFFRRHGYNTKPNSFYSRWTIAIGKEI